MVQRSAITSRLGLNVPAGWWPTAATAKSFEAAGFSWIQVHTPPRAVLCRPDQAVPHAQALRAALKTTDLGLVLHAPDDLSAGVPGQDRALAGLLDYAVTANASFVAYHGANFPGARDDAGAAAVRDRLIAEERSLRKVIPRLEAAEIVLAIENLAPTYPSGSRLSHAPAVVRGLVDRLASPSVRMLFDVGHAHIVGDTAGGSLAGLLDSVAGSVGLIHLHDNLGSRRRSTPPPMVDPLRLDLHLAPGAGTVPWQQIGLRLCELDAPLMLEVHPPHRPEPLSLFGVTSELLLAGELARV